MDNRGIIYDFGMNNGDNLEYYLLKGSKVVGVEANTDLCNEVKERFADQIDSGRLAILNVALVENETSETVTFYLHKTNHVLSQLPEPDASIRDQFEAVQIECRTPASIIRQFGEPLYVKIDVEHYDANILKNIFGAGIYPPEISAESHSVDVFAILVANGYNSFSLVDGGTVSQRYGRTEIRTSKGRVPFAFKHHSAGPFGEDIRAPWQDADTFFYTLAGAFLGWKDIHASRVMNPEPRPSDKAILARLIAAIGRKLALGVQARVVAAMRIGRNSPS